MGAGQARHDLAAEAARAQDDLRAAHRHHQVGDRDLPLGRRAGAAEEGDLPAAQHRPRQDVADPPLRQVDDLREQRAGGQGLLGAQVLGDLPRDLGVGVAEAAEQAGARGADRAPEEDAEVAGVERLLRRGGDRRHHLERVGQGRQLGGLAGGCRSGGGRQAVDVLGGEVDLPAAGGERVGEEGEQVGFARRPGHRRVGCRGADRQSLEEGGGLGAGVARLLETDPDLLVEHLDERHLPLLAVAIGKVLAELLEQVGPPAGDPAQQRDAALDLGEHGGAERGSGGRLDHVELEEAGELDRGGQVGEPARDLAVALRRLPRPGGVEPGERVARPGQALPGVGGQPGEPLDQVVHRLRTGDRRRQLRDQDLAVDQLADIGGGVLGGDLAVGVGGDQGGGQVGDARAATGARERRLQVLRPLDRDQVVGAHLVDQAGLGVAQPAGGAVEARVGAVEELGAQRRVAPEVLAEGEEVVHVEAGVAAVGGARPEGEAGRRPGCRVDGAERAAGEEAERGGARRHAEEVAHQGALGALPLLAVGVALPGGQAFVEGGGGEEESLEDLGAPGERGQPRAEPLAVGGEGALQPFGIVRPCPGRRRGGRGLEPLAERLQLVEGEQGGAEREEARGDEGALGRDFSHGLPR